MAQSNSKAKNRTKTKRIPFEIKDCALVGIATGKKAQTLRELRDILQTIHPDSIYYHFWGGLLRPRFENPEFNNDFASWARHALHDKDLAEKLGIIDPTDLTDLEEIRIELLDIIEERLDASEYVPWSSSDERFYFITSQIVVFDTRKVIKEPKELEMVIPAMSPGSIFYHFIDARRRTFGNLDDFRAWLYGFNEMHDLCGRLATVDPFFSTLTELRSQLTDVVSTYFRESGQ